MKRIDPLLRHVPWKIAAVFFPLERVLSRLEIDGTVETAGRQVVFKEDMHGGWYDMVAALRGVIQFHDLAASRHSLPIDLSAMVRFANKLEAVSPIFESDIEAMKTCIEACKQQAMKLRVSEATSIVDTVRISAEMDRLKGIAA